MNTKIIAVTIAAVTVLSITVMACSGGDYEDEYYEPTEDTSVEYTSSDTDSPEDTNNQEIPNKCVIHANKKNKLGSIVLVATYNGVEYTKTIQIVPLW